MMQADALLLERGACVLGRRRADPDRRASADAVISCVGVDDRLQPEKRQQLAIERAGAFEIRGGQKNMRDAVVRLLPVATTISDGKSPVWTVPGWQEKKGCALQDRSVQSYWSLAARLKMSARRR